MILTSQQNRRKLESLKRKRMKLHLNLYQSRKRKLRKLKQELSAPSRFQMALFMRVSLKKGCLMDRVSKNGHKMMRRNINISSILVLG